MEGKDKQLIQMMDGSENRFIIPVYQRNYDWKEAQCKQLFKDLLNVIQTGRDSHFFGGIVRTHALGDGTHDFLIIDGQQRLTTITLLLLALYKNINEGSIRVNDSILGKKIWNKFIVDEYQPAERKIRLKPIKDDCEAFDHLVFDSKEDYIMSSNVTLNYLFFDKKIKELQDDITADDLFRAIGKLIVIDISLGKDDDPQLIFESLNSTGLDLNEADKIRNFILMGLESTVQDKYYECYWNKIEKNTNYKVSTFVRDYLTLKTGKIASVDKVYFTFKDYVIEPIKQDTEDVLKDLLHYSLIYKGIITSDLAGREVNYILKHLNQLDMTVIYPYLMALFNYANETLLPESELLRVLQTLEIYLFRRLICGIPTNALNKIFAALHKETLRKKGSDDSYCDVLIYTLQNKTGNSTFPKDEDFRYSFVTRNIYSMQSKNKMYLFERLENRDSKEVGNIIELMENGQYTIEHIMPQTLNDKWRDSLGVDYKRIHSDWLNTIANLTLTAYNSTYRNRPFNEKKEIEKGFADSPLRLNQFIKTCTKWTELELKERRGLMAKLALTLWEYPTTSFLPKDKESEVISLADDYDFKGRSIHTFIFMDTSYKVIDWTDVLVYVTKLLFELESSIIYKCVSDSDNSNFVKYEKNSSHKIIAEGVYINSNNNTNTKISILKDLLDKYDLDYNELGFALNPIKED